MSNRVLFLRHGLVERFHDLVMCLSPEGTGMKLKNKYFEVELEFDLETSRLPTPPAVIWISSYPHCDKVLPPSHQYENSELRLLLRVCPSGEFPEMSEELKDWEVDNFAEVINVNPDTFAEEVHQFLSGARSSLLDSDLQPAGCRLLESLEMVEWPLKLTAGKSPTEQKIEAMIALLSQEDPECVNFERAMGIMMELKSIIPTLPDKERHEYAAQVAIAFAKILGEDEEEDEGNEEEAQKEIKQAKMDTEEKPIPEKPIPEKPTNQEQTNSDESQKVPNKTEESLTVESTPTGKEETQKEVSEPAGTGVTEKGDSIEYGKKNEEENQQEVKKKTITWSDDEDELQDQAFQKMPSEDEDP